tara:strand:+ start:190 stop:540 length:351 start_codon:yes stop_codon:yes gene_type:complete
MNRPEAAKKTEMTQAGYWLICAAFCGCLLLVISRAITSSEKHQADAVVPDDEPAASSWPCTCIRRDVSPAPRRFFAAEFSLVGHGQERQILGLNHEFSTLSQGHLCAFAGWGGQFG